MNDFDAAVEWLVTTCRAKSKGEARRNLITHALTQVEDFGVTSVSDHPAGWMERVAGGIAGASPAIDKASDAIARVTIAEERLAKARRLANRDISHAGQSAGIAYAATMEQLKPRPWWKRIFDA